MICSECGKIIEFYSPELEAIQDAMAVKYRFELTSHLLRMIGICADCRRQKRDQKQASRNEKDTKQRSMRVAARGSHR